MKNNKIVTIDGPSGVGKTTVAQRVSDQLGLSVINSGRLFRAIAWAISQENIDVDDEALVSEQLSRIDVGMTETGEVTVDGNNVTKEVEGPKIGVLASKVAEYASVRQKLLIIQRRLGDEYGCVIEGRSTAIEVFPHACLKIWLTASLDARREWVTKLHSLEAAQTILERDQEDYHRALAPMGKADDAVEIDATNMTMDEVVAKIVSLFRTRQEK